MTAAGTTRVARGPVSPAWEHRRRFVPRGSPGWVGRLTSRKGVRGVR